MSFFNKLIVGLLIVANTFIYQLQSVDFSKYAKASEKEDSEATALSEADVELARIPDGGQVEMEEKRTKYSKTYLKSDGSKELEISSIPVNYQDGSGSWGEIDTSLVDGSNFFRANNNSDYINKSNSFSLEVPKNLKEKLFSIDKESNSVSVSLDNETQESLKKGLSLGSPYLALGKFATLSDDKVKYRNVWPNIDIELISTPEGVKENIILNKYTKKNKFTFNIEIKDSRVEKFNQNGYKFYDLETGELNYVIPPFIAYDAEYPALGDKQNFKEDLETSITQNESGYEIKIKVDDNWLSDPETKYPVVIDPSFIAELGYGEDTYVQQNYPNYNMWVNKEMFIGNHYNKGITRAMIPFFIGEDLTNARILSANFSTWQTYSSYPGTGEESRVNAFLVKDFDCKGVTWNNQPQYLGVVGSSTTLGSTIINIDVTVAAQSWFAGNPYGSKIGALAFASNDESWVGYRIWNAENNPNTSRDQEPRLVIDYNDYNAQYQPSGALSAVAGTTVETPITVWNTGRNWWSKSRTGISYQLFDNATGKEIIRDGEYVALPKDVAPGGDWTTILAKVKAPPKAGNYTIFWNLLQPGITWFESQGVARSGQALTVSLPSFSSMTHLGSEPYYSKSGPVDLASGNMAFSSTDMSLPSDTGGMQLTRSYNSIDATLPYDQDDQGFMRSWLLNGVYYDSNSNNRFVTNYLGDDSKVLPNNGVASGNNLWFDYKSSSGSVDFYKAVSDVGLAQSATTGDCAIYAHNYVYSPSDRDVFLKIGSDDGIRIWLNGSLVFSKNYFRGVSIDNDIIRVRLNKGWNPLMIKVTQGYGGWGMIARFTDLDNNLMNDLKYALNNPDLVDMQGVLGDNWTTNLEEKIIGIDTKIVYYRDSTGTVNAFYSEGAGYKEPPGVNFTLSKNDDETFLITYSDGWKKKFNVWGDVEWIEDTSNNRSTYIYDENRRCIKIAEGSRSIDFSYDDMGYLVSSTNQLGDSFTYIFEETSPGVKRFIGFRDLMDKEYKYKFASINDNKIIEYINPRGYGTKFTYSSDGRVTKIVDALGNTTNIIYSEGKTEIVDALGRRSSYQFNQANILTYFTNAKNYKEFYQYDSDYNLISTMPVLPENDNYYYKYSYTYDLNGNLLTETDPMNNTAKYVYDSNNNLIKATTPKGEIYTYTYNDARLLSSKTDPSGATSYYNYGAKGRLLNYQDPDGKKMRYTYNSDGDMLKEITPKWETTLYQYDVLGRVKKMTSPLGKTVSYKYNKRSQISKVIDSRGSIIKRYVYDVNGNISIEFDANGNTRRYFYNRLDQVIRVTDEVGASVRYEYDEVGNCTKMIDAIGNETTFQYDELNQIVSKVDAAGNKTLLNYDRNGNIVSVKDKNGEVTTNTYDKAGQITFARNPSGTAQYIYDKNGNPTKVTFTSNNENNNIAYDSSGRVTEVQSNVAGDNSYTYDSSGNLTQTDSATNKINYSYDENGAVSSVTNSTKDSRMLGKIEITRDAEGKMTSWKNMNGDVTSYTYDDLLQVTNIRTDNRPENPIWHNLTYTYGKIGNVIKIDDYFNGAKYFAYDQRSELITDSDYKYEYDLMGNRTKLTSRKDGSVFQYSYDEEGDANRLLSVIGPETNINYIYDKIGNVVKKTSTSEGETQYTYDSDGYFTKAVLPNGVSIEYKYDKLANRRIERIQTGIDGTKKITRFVYDGDKLISETDQGGNIIISYTWDENENLASFTIKENDEYATYYYLKNVKGDIIGFTDMWGQEIARYEYDSWGNITHAGKTFDGNQFHPDLNISVNPRLYGGYWYDQDLGLYFMKTRMYDPKIGRFLSPDKAVYGGMPLDLNPYLYCGNNPINRVDPDGKFAVPAVLGAGLIGGGMATGGLLLAGVALGILVIGYIATHPIQIASVSKSDASATVSSSVGGMCAASPGGSNHQNPNKSRKTSRSSSRSVKKTPANSAKAEPMPTNEIVVNNSKTRSLSVRNQYLKGIVDKSPKWMRQSLESGKVPKGYQVHHVRPLFKGGLDTIENMSIRDIEMHKTATRLWRLIK